MADLIDRQVAINEAYPIYIDGESFDVVQVETLMGMPSVEVVWCKDCKHSTEWYRDKRRCFLWHEDGIDVFEDGYCSYGERF